MSDPLAGAVADPVSKEPDWRDNCTHKRVGMTYYLYRNVIKEGVATVEAICRSCERVVAEFVVCHKCGTLIPKGESCETGFKGTNYPRCTVDCKNWDI